MKALTLITAEDQFLASLELGRVRAHWESKGYSTEEATTDDVVAVFNALDTPAMFGDGRFVIVRGQAGPLDAEVERLTAWAESPPPGLACALVVGRATKLRKALGRGAEVIEASAPKPWETGAWVVTHMKGRGRQMTPEAAEALVEALGTDLRELATACEQLTLATSTRIGVDVVQRMFRGLDSQLYTFLDALLQRDRSAALKHLHSLLGVGEYHPLVLTATLAKQYRALAAGKGTERVAAATLAKELDITVGYVNRAFKHGRNFTPEDVRTGFRLIADADDTLKGGERGNELPEHVVMELLVSQLAGDRPAPRPRARATSRR